MSTFKNSNSAPLVRINAEVWAEIAADARATASDPTEIVNDALRHFYQMPLCGKWSSPRWREGATTGLWGAMGAAMGWRALATSSADLWRMKGSNELALAALGRGQRSPPPSG